MSIVDVDDDANDVTGYGSHVRATSWLQMVADEQRDTGLVVRWAGRDDDVVVWMRWRIDDRITDLLQRDDIELQ